MLFVPALIVAVIFGLVGAVACLIAGYGIRASLVAYWLSGNLGLMATMMPSLLSLGPSSGNAETVRKPRVVFPALWAVAWISLGLTLIAWQQFLPDLQGNTVVRHDVAAVFNIAPIGDGLSIADDQGGKFTGAITSVAAWLGQLPIWLLGLLAYLYGLTRFFLTAANRLTASD